jgi:hypothetical protein
VGALAAVCGACGPSSSGPAGSISSGPGDASFIDASDDGPAPTGQPGDARPDEGAADGVALPADGATAADVGTDAPVLPADRFVTGVVSFEPGACAGFGASSMPQIVEGPPVGAGSDHGSTDVVSLGTGGTIVLSFAPNAIVDGPGPDFIVFENPFWVSGNSNDVFAEPGEVSVSDDGVAWQTFPCNPTVDPNSAHGTGVSPPYGQCAGWHVVNSSPTNGISPVDPAVAGGDAFDLADLGVSEARYVRIVDRTLETCADAGARPNNDGFDLDAIAIVNASQP